MGFDAFRSGVLVGWIGLVGAGCDDGSAGSPVEGSTAAELTSSDTTGGAAAEGSTTGSASTTSGGSALGSDSSTGAAPTDADSSSGDSTGASTGDSAVSEGDVLVDIAYAGSLDGTLTTALFGACPPAGPPASFSQVLPADVAFPQRVDLLSTGLAGGASGCVVSFLDVDPPTPTAPGPEDPVGQVMFDVTPGAATEVSLTLQDPS